MYKKNPIFATVRVWPFSVRYSHPYTLFLQTRMTNKPFINGGWICYKMMRVPMYVYAFLIQEGFCLLCIRHTTSSKTIRATLTTVYVTLLANSHCCCCSVCMYSCTCISVCCLMQCMFHLVLLLWFRCVWDKMRMCRSQYSAHVTLTDDIGSAESGHCISFVPCFWHAMTLVLKRHSFFRIVSVFLYLQFSTRPVMI